MLSLIWIYGLTGSMLSTKYTGDYPQYFPTILTKKKCEGKNVALRGNWKGGKIPGRRWGKSEGNHGKYM